MLVYGTAEALCHDVDSVAQAYWRQLPAHQLLLLLQQELEEASQSRQIAQRRTAPRASAPILRLLCDTCAGAQLHSFEPAQLAELLRLLMQAADSGSEVQPSVQWLTALEHRLLAFQQRLHAAKLGERPAKHACTRCRPFRLGKEHWQPAIGHCPLGRRKEASCIGSALASV